MELTENIESFLLKYVSTGDAKHSTLVILSLISVPAFLEPQGYHKMLYENIGFLFHCFLSADIR